MGFPDGKWSGDAIYHSNVGIESYINALLITPFGNLKEEVTKFIFSRYKKGNLWIPELVNITPQIIVVVVHFPTMRDPISLTNRNPTLLQDIIGTQATKSSKGLKISQIKNGIAKWEAIIISIYLTNSS